LLEVSGVAKDFKDRATGDTTRDRGLAVEFQIPLFDFGEVRARQAEQTYLQAVNRLAEKAVNARSQAREAYRTYRAAYDIAAHYRTEVLPLRKIISEEMLLRYNAMQVDVFELLTEARRRTASINASVEAQRDFWLATVDLAVSETGGGVSGGASEASAMAGAAPAEGGGH
jgi:outer membrane protein TolC